MCGKWMLALPSNSMNGLRQPNFGPVEGDEVKPRFALDGFTDHTSFSDDACTASSMIFCSISTSLIACSTTPGSG